MDALKVLTPRLAALTELGAMRIHGADARSFLQGQLSNDLRVLSATRTLLAAQTTPRGRVMALHRVLERGDGLVAVLPAALVAPAIERLRRYILRAKVQLSDASAEFAVAGLFDVDVPRPRLAADDHHEANGISTVRI